MRRSLSALGWIVGGYLIVRAIAEPFLIDFSDPASYASDWGGPSLVGVLAVHMVPGVVAASLMLRVLRRRLLDPKVGAGRHASRT